MCGRYLLTAPAEAMREIFGFIERPNLPPRYNIAPTLQVPVVRQRRNPPGERTLQLLRWGLVPPWAKDLSGGAKMINARADTIAEKPAFRQPFEKRRCLVPADGFYEWRPGDPEKRPYLIRPRDGTPVAFAGVWDRWTPPADPPPERPYIDSFAIVTTEANETLRPLHHRMPVIVAPEDYAAWLDPGAEIASLRALLRPAPEDRMIAVPVDRRVNSVRNDDADLLRPHVSA
jgi:putative SOS response-associated peptidase YedK